MPYEKCVNAEQENAIERLKNRIKNELTSPALLQDDAIFYKFLKARNFDIDKAEKMLRKHIVWRKVYQIGDILEIFKPKEVFVKYGEPNFIGYDKEGDLVIFTACAGIHSANWFKCIKMNDCVKHWIWFAEKNKASANKTNKKMSLSAIVDLDKLEFSNAAAKLSIDFVMRVTYVMRDNYAERVKAIYFINTPSYFVTMFTIIKTLLSYSIIKRLHVFGCSDWKKKLVEDIDADILPAFLGGKQFDPDGDPFCKSFITLPGIIPEIYYLSEEDRYFGHSDEVSTILIPPSEKKEIFIDVEDVYSSIRWKFMVKKKTIFFGLFCEQPRKQMKEIIPLYEYDTSDGTEENFYNCLFIGTYIIAFDNSHSRFSSKEVQYSITVEKRRIQH